MRCSAFLAAALAGAATLSFGAAAMAQPGPKILTTGSKAARASMTPGVSHEAVMGVHLFKGAATAPSSGSDLLGGGAMETNCEEIVVNYETRPWRRMRHLRTQGFYSGVPYRSRGYVQGFYSTGR